MGKARSYIHHDAGAVRGRNFTVVYDTSQLDVFGNIQKDEKTVKIPYSVAKDFPVLQHLADEKIKDLGYIDAKVVAIRNYLGVTIWKKKE